VEPPPGQAATRGGRDQRAMRSTLVANPVAPSQRSTAGVNSCVFDARLPHL
jgi:hypothetical protein